MRCTVENIYLVNLKKIIMIICLFVYLTVNIEESGPPRKKRPEAVIKPVPVAVEIPNNSDPKVKGKKDTDKASDDFYFEKFRRQFRR